MLIPSKLKEGDTIGIIAPSNPITKNNVKEINIAKSILENKGFRVKYSKHLFENTNGYSENVKKKVDDIHNMFLNSNIKMIWCATGGYNSNALFDFLDYELIKNNPKIFCGYSDISSLNNIIYEMTGLVTFCGSNFKNIRNEYSNYNLNAIIQMLVNGNIELGEKNDEYKVINHGKTQGILVGGNLRTIKGLVSGKYKINFEDKILFIEDFGKLSDPALLSNCLYYMKQNNAFDQIKGLWIGNYEHSSGISLEKIVLDTLDNDINFPIIKSNNFGHIENKIVIPIGIEAKIDTNKNKMIQIIEKCIK